MKDTWGMLTVVWLMLIYAHFQEGTTGLFVSIAALIIATVNLVISVGEALE